MKPELSRHSIIHRSKWTVLGKSRAFFRTGKHFYLFLIAICILMLGPLDARLSGSIGPLQGETSTLSAQESLADEIDRFVIFEAFGVPSKVGGG